MTTATASGLPPAVRVAVAARARVGEGPVWDPAAGRLHWVDILAGALHTSDLAAGQTTTITVPTLLGAAVPRQCGGFVGATAEGFATIGADGSFVMRVRLLADSSRMNDAKCDPQGRLWAGSTDLQFAPAEGALHVLLPDWSSRVVLTRLTQPNGLGWSPDGTVFYLIDTAERTLFAWDFSATDATLHRRRELHCFNTDGVPDGLCVDTAGRIWVAMWGGSEVVCLGADGRILGRFEVGVEQPSSCAFVGPGLAALAVTSAREGLENAAADTPDGSVLVLEQPAIGGLPAEGVPVSVFAG